MHEPSPDEPRLSRRELRRLRAAQEEHARSEEAGAEATLPELPAAAVFAPIPGVAAVPAADDLPAFAPLPDLPDAKKRPAVPGFQALPDLPDAATAHPVAPAFAPLPEVTGEEPHPQTAPFAPLPALGAAAAEEVAPAPTILTVCTGNICRSPMGEAMLRAALVDLGVRVHSAGTQALVGHEMTELAQDIATDRGAFELDVVAHRARYLTEPILAESDLVLAMTREHRSHIVQMLPSVLRRTFTVREFARLAATLTEEQVRAAVSGETGPGERLRALAALVGAQRGSLPAAPEDDDVEDPYRRPRAVYEASADQLEPGIDAVSRLVRAALG